MCKNADCELYPIFGVAPHECYWRKDGGFEENPLGTSTIEPLQNWPNNFLAEIEPDIDVKQQLSWGLCGVYFCPECMKGVGAFTGLLGKDEILKLTN